jgi:hypothetical protein
VIAIFFVESMFKMMHKVCRFKRVGSFNNNARGETIVNRFQSVGCPWRRSNTLLCYLGEGVGRKQGRILRDINRDK